MATPTITYGGTTLNDWDGTKGVIVSTVTHDSSPDVTVSEQEIARGHGRSLRDFRYSGKTITVTGSIVGTSQADFEQRLDAFKNLLSTPQGRLTVSSYGTLDYRIATFEHGEGWTRQILSASTGNQWNYTNYKIGTRGLTVQSNTGSGARTASWVAYKDLGDFATTDTIKLWAYIDDASKLTSIRLRFETTAGSVYYSTTWSSGFANGWNELTALRSAFTTNGSPLWSNINNIELQVTGSNATAVNVTFDDLRVSTTADTRAYECSINASVDLTRDFYNVDWCNFQASFTAPEGLSTATNGIVSQQGTTNDIQHEPFFFLGSGPQSLIYRGGIRSAAAEKATFYDHWADNFGGYGTYRTSVATFESTETWSSSAADTSNFRVGSQGVRVTATSPTLVTSTRTISSTDYSTLADNMKTQLAIYVDDSTKLTEVIVLFDSTAGVAGYSKSVTGLVTGWNIVTIAKSAFTQYGGGNWAAIVSLSLTVNPTGGTVNVTFDDWNWVHAQNVTGGVYTSNANAWTIADYAAYPHALVSLSTTVDTTFVLTNDTFRDGEVIALVNGAAGATVGVCGRLETTNSLLNANYSAGERFVTGSYVSAATTAFSLNGGQNDGSIARMVLAQTDFSVALNTVDTWMWLRLVCKGSTAWLYSRQVSEDTWTLRVTGPVRETAAGYWGLHTSGFIMRCAHLEIINYAKDQKNALTLHGGPFGSSANDGNFLLDSKSLTLREGPWTGFPTGSFPNLVGGLNRASFIIPSSVIGTQRFRYVQDNMTGATAFGGATNTKVAASMPSGSQTYIRRRGTFIYLAKLIATPPANNITVRIETDTAGAPSGSLVHANATKTISNADIQTYLAATSSTWNGSVVPIEVVWPADIAVSAATTYWLVITPSSAEAGDYWLAPYQADTSANRLYIYNGSWALATGSAKTGYAVLAGNVPGLASGVRHSVYRPTFL